MPRFPRVVVPGAAHHVLQRSSHRETAFNSAEDRLNYLDLLVRHCRETEIEIVGYCLMPDHVHLLLIPGQAAALTGAMRRTHARYAQYFNARCKAAGRLWQARYLSCPVDMQHVWQALRYVEMNPVRAGIAKQAAEWKWSSAPAHSLDHPPVGVTDLRLWSKHATTKRWRETLTLQQEDELVNERIRQATLRGTPFASAETIERWERQLGRKVEPKKPGRRRSERILAAIA